MEVFAILWKQSTQQKFKTLAKDLQQKLLVVWVVWHNHPFLQTHKLGTF